jgi:hypothetical protein
MITITIDETKFEKCPALVDALTKLIESSESVMGQADWMDAFDLGRQYMTPRKDLILKLSEFCETNKLLIPCNRAFFRELRLLGCEDIKTKGERMIRGIRIKHVKE